MNEFRLLNTRPLAKRSALPASVLFHCALITALALLPHQAEPVGFVRHPSYKRSVILLRLRDFPYPVRRSQGAEARRADSARGAAGRPGATFQLARAEAPTHQADSHETDAGIKRDQPHRAFELPADIPKRPRPQTIVQIDVPPEVVLKQDVPLPNVVLWTAQQPPPFRRQFVAPKLKELPRKVAQNLPVAPELQLANREPNVSDLKISAALVRDVPHLPRPPATTAPIRMPRQVAMNEVPQIIIPDSNLADAAAIISIVDSPVRNGIVMIPAANQTSASGGADSSGSGSGQGSKSGQKANGGQGSGLGAQTGTGSGTGAGGELAGEGANKTGIGNGSGSGLLASAGGGHETGFAAGSANSGSGSGTDGAGGDPANGLDAYAASVTRLTLPKDGKFGVVVMGSSQAVPYPETVGALSGKMVYTVYLGVGLHKKWILQYCLTRDAEKSLPKGSATPLEAPWPFLIFRPDNLVGSNDYVIVHGLINTEGKFDKLSMVFPDQFDQKDLLINSLKLWALRPASRDRVPTAVEVLLIIPGES